MQYFQRIILFTAFLALFVACDSNAPAEDPFIPGESTTLGNGEARTYAVVEDGLTTSIGVILTEEALSGLGMEMISTVLRFPAEATGLPVDHLTVDWNPHGHEPPGVYDIPHFDFHFYLISPAQRAAIDPGLIDFDEKAARTPDPRHIPQGYVPTPGAVPGMGAHWVDPTSPEFSPDGFSRTFIYGFWDGEMNFLEPMITKAYIESVKAMPEQSVRFAVPQPEAFQKAGRYPTHYSISYDAEARTYQFALEGLTHHNSNTSEAVACSNPDISDRDTSMSGALCRNGDLPE